ncbi:MAG: alpha/beta fold hydrolase [Pseudorhodoplanes sp.]|nr:hypothetical protein [Pseudorhodoplanes sp.]MBW7949041.1 alpha/beta fold hydrolase [Pseudorhodoplanes sp.]
MAAFKSIAFYVVAGYIGFVAVMYFAQRWLMYFPETVRTAPAEAGFAQAEEIALTAADGERLLAWHVAPHAGRFVVVYYHGNGGALRHRPWRFAPLTSDGTGLVALSYRGYGGSSGHPSEQGLIADGRAAYDFAAARYGAERIVLWGESLGSGVAIAVAAERPVAALVLEAPYTSTVDIAAAIYPVIPVRWLMKDQFRSDERIGRIDAPLLVLHGERDRVIPIRFGARLFALAPGPKRFVRFPGAGHEDLGEHGAVEAARAFLSDVAQRRPLK